MAYRAVDDYFASISARCEAVMRTAASSTSPRAVEVDGPATPELVRLRARALEKQQQHRLALSGFAGGHYSAASEGFAAADADAELFRQLMETDDVEGVMSAYDLSALSHTYLDGSTAQPSHLADEPRAALEALPRSAESAFEPQPHPAPPPPPPVRHAGVRIVRNDESQMVPMSKQLAATVSAAPPSKESIAEQPATSRRGRSYPAPVLDEASTDTPRSADDGQTAIRPQPQRTLQSPAANDSESTSSYGDTTDDLTEDTTPGHPVRRVHAAKPVRVHHQRTASPHVWTRSADVTVSRPLRGDRTGGVSQAVQSGPAPAVPRADMRRGDFLTDVIPPEQFNRALSGQWSAPAQGLSDVSTVSMADARPAPTALSTAPVRPAQGGRRGSAGSAAAAGPAGTGAPAAAPRGGAALAIVSSAGGRPPPPERRRVSRTATPRDGDPGLSRTASGRSPKTTATPTEAAPAPVSRKATTVRPATPPPPTAAHAQDKPQAAPRPASVTREPSMTASRQASPPTATAAPNPTPAAPTAETKSAGVEYVPRLQKVGARGCFCC